MQLAKGWAIVIALLALGSLLVHTSNGAVAGSVTRIFYFSPSGRLSISSTDLSSLRNVTLSNRPVTFNFPNPLSPPPYAKVSGTMTLSLWLATNQTSTVVPVTIQGAFNESLGRGGNLIQSDVYTNSVSGSVPRAYNFTINLDDQFLFQSSMISVSLKLASPIPLGNVTMLYGSNDYPSYAVLPLVSYAGLDSSRGPLILITDPISQNPSTSFDLNSSFRQVRFQVFVDSALGFEDIDRVNLTIIGPSGIAVFSNPMDPSPPSNTPYEWHVFWSYPATADEGVYHAWVDIFDFQKNHAYSLHGSATFGLSRTNPITRAALNLLPYVSVTGVGIGAAAVYYRRRKTKSYFAPFDYFNTLTGGPLSGGSAVTIEGNTGSGKTLLSEQLMFEDLKRGKPCVFLATGDFPSNIRASMKSMGLDTTGYEQNGSLTFVDGYSSEAGQESREKIYVPSLGDLTTLGMKISTSLPDDSFRGGSLYFDSITPLASKAKPENLVSFVQSVGARVKGLGGKAFFTLGPSIDPVVQKQLEEMADCVVQMEAFEESGVRKSRMRVSKLRSRRHQQGWVIYTIEDGKGIIFYSKSPKR